MTDDSSKSEPHGSSKIYTRTGDKGKTSLIGGTRVSKSHLRLETYGTIDELNSVIGLVISDIALELSGDMVSAEGRREKATLVPFLHQVQSDLFEIGSRLACEDKGLRERLPLVHEDHIHELELKMDEFSESLPELKNFILPGGSRAAATAQIARTVCRRAERLCVAMNEGGSHIGVEDVIEPVIVRYVNRLSDFFFVLARHVNRLSGSPEILWAPRAK